MTKNKNKKWKHLTAFLLCGGVFLFLASNIIAEEEIIKEANSEVEGASESSKKEEEGDDAASSQMNEAENETDVKEEDDLGNKDSGDTAEGRSDSENEDKNDNTQEKSEDSTKKNDTIQVQSLAPVPETVPEMVNKDDEKTIGSESDRKEVTALEIKKGDVVINEVAWMGTENSSNDEWIELKNETDENIDLDDWTLASEDGTPSITISGDISGGGYFLLERTDDTSVPDVGADQIYTGALGNGGEFLKLKDKEGNTIDEIDASGGWPAGDNSEKLTMEKDGDDWQDSCETGGTPRAKNSNKDDCGPPDDQDYGDVFINELLPDPIGSDKGEWIELYNDENEKVSLSGWSIKDKTRTYDFSDQEIEAKSYLILTGKLSLNNSGDKLELINPKGEVVSQTEYPQAPTGRAWARNAQGNYDWTFYVTPGEKNKFPIPGQFRGKIIFNEVLSNPKGKDKNFEWVELKSISGEIINLEGWQIKNGSGKRFNIPNEVIKPGELKVIIIRGSSMALRNRNEKLKLIDLGNETIDEVFVAGYARSSIAYVRDDKGKWSWSKKPTPGKKNWINHPPRIKIKKSKKAYKDVYTFFDASDTEDKDKDKLKFKWDFGNGHYSYKDVTSQKYEKKKTYKVTLRVDDGSDQFYKSFKVEVKSFPKYDLRLIRLVPNPAGKDSGNEIIWIMNMEDREIDLKNFKIATGKDESSLVNHPIYEEFILGPGEWKEITNAEICKFALQNKTGFVKLLYPNYKTADEVGYAKEKITDNEAYVLVDDHWEWVGGETVEAEEPEVLVEGIKSILEWWQITGDESIGWCECFQKMTIENWKEKNSIWLRFLI